MSIYSRPVPPPKSAFPQRPIDWEKIDKEFAIQRKLRRMEWACETPRQLRTVFLWLMLAFGFCEFLAVIDPTPSKGNLVYWGGLFCLVSLGALISHVSLKKRQKALAVFKVIQRLEN